MNFREPAGPAQSASGFAPTSVYVRLSVTDRCNLRCVYCRPLNDAPLAPRNETLRYEEMLSLLDLLHGIQPVRKVRITGGEPLLRAELPTLVTGLREHLPHAELCLTTNGTLLARHATSLHAAGLDRINVSLDSADSLRLAELTRGGSLDHILAGLRAAQAAGFRGIKINAVLLRSVNGDQLAHLVRTAAEHACETRFIELMPVGDGAGLFVREFLAAGEARARLDRVMEHRGEIGANGTARLHRFFDRGREVRVGFISSVSHPFCNTCDRLRLDCRGRLFSCLRHSEGIDLVTALRRGATAAVEAGIRSLLSQKNPGSGWPQHRMVAIGG
jgi:cyclic pyranopterin phosphate synthase